MKAAMVLIVGILISGCASFATKEERDAAARAWADCTMRQIMKLDDGKSDPLSIAYGVAPACGALYQQLTDVMMQGMTTEKSQAFMRNTMREGELKDITSAVLTYRASRTKR